MGCALPPFITIWVGGMSSVYTSLHREHNFTCEVDKSKATGGTEMSQPDKTDVFSLSEEMLVTNESQLPHNTDLWKYFLKTSVKGQSSVSALFVRIDRRVCPLVAFVAGKAKTCRCCHGSGSVFVEIKVWDLSCRVALQRDTSSEIVHPTRVPPEPAQSRPVKLKQKVYLFAEHLGVSHSN